MVLPPCSEEFTERDPVCHFFSFSLTFYLATNRAHISATELKQLAATAKVVRVVVFVDLGDHALPRAQGRSTAIRYDQFLLYPSYFSYDGHAGGGRRSMPCFPWAASLRHRHSRYSAWWLLSLLVRLSWLPPS
jgi:hypothetical protein